VLRDKGWLGTRELPADDLPAMVRIAIEVGQRGLVLVADEFQDLFECASPATYRPFAAHAAECLAEHPDRFRLVVGIREDHLARLLELEEQWPAVLHHVMRLSPLTTEQASDAILKPGAPFGVYPPEDLAQRIIADLGRDAISPPELQIVLDRLYESAPYGSGMNVKNYERLGGAERILDEAVEFPLRNLPPRDRRLARAILAELTGPGRLSWPLPLERLCLATDEQREAVERVLARLADLRLVRAYGKERARRYELIQPWLGQQAAEGLTARQMRAKECLVALWRHLDDHQHGGALLPRELTVRIHDYRDELRLLPDELELVIRSAAEHDVHPSYWLGRAKELGDGRVEVLEKLLEHPTDQVRRTVASGLGQTADPEAITLLVESLSDRDETVRRAATEGLDRQEDALAGSLQAPDPRQRERAAKGLAVFGGRRSVPRLIDALRDDDDSLRVRATEALAQLGDRKTEELLLRRLQTEKHPPWAVAYALGELATEAGVLSDLHAAAERAGEPHLVYALARALVSRGELDEAERLLQQARETVHDGPAIRAVEAALRNISAQRSDRRDARLLDWPMFHGGSDHTGVREHDVRPPLSLKWECATQDAVVSSPAVIGGFVYAGSRDGSLYCVDEKTGVMQWKLATRDRIESSPAVADGLVAIGSHDGFVYAADARTGARRWRTRVGSAVRAACTVAENLLLAGTRDGRLVALHWPGGKPAWQFAAQAEVYASPAVADETIVFGAWDRRIRALDLAGRQRWEATTQGEVWSAPAIRHDRVYSGSDDGLVRCLDLHTGELLWQAALGGPVRSCPAVARRVLVVGDMVGNVSALAADSGQLLWQAQTAEDITTAPAVAGSVVFVGGKDGALHAFDLHSGEEVWQRSTAYGIYSSPAIGERGLYIGMHYYSICAFTTEAGLEAELAATREQPRPAGQEAKP